MRFRGSVEGGMPGIEGIMGSVLVKALGLIH